MKSVLCPVVGCLFIVGCQKENAAPATTTTTPAAVPNADQLAMTPEGNYPSTITLFVNHISVPVTAINFDRSSGTFNFSAEGKTQKVDVNCFWFYQQSRWSYQFSDTISYSVRADSLSDWQPKRRLAADQVDFDCCDARLLIALLRVAIRANSAQLKTVLL